MVERKLAGAHYGLRDWAMQRVTAVIMLIYTVLFGKTAKELKQERNVKDNDLLRDSFEGEELTRVSEAETIVTALISLGFNHDYIKIQLQNKYKLTLSK